MKNCIIAIVAIAMAFAATSCGNVNRTNSNKEVNDSVVGIKNSVPDFNDSVSNLNDSIPNLNDSVVYTCYLWSTGETTPTKYVMKPGEWMCIITQEYASGTVRTTARVFVKKGYGLKRLDARIR